MKLTDIKPTSMRKGTLVLTMVYIPGHPYAVVYKDDGALVVAQKLMVYGHQLLDFSSEEEYLRTRLLSEIKQDLNDARRGKAFAAAKIDNLQKSLRMPYEALTPKKEDA